MADPKRTQDITGKREGKETNYKSRTLFGWTWIKYIYGELKNQKKKKVVWSYLLSSYLNTVSVTRDMLMSSMSTSVKHILHLHIVQSV